MRHYFLTSLLFFTVIISFAQKKSTTAAKEKIVRPANLSDSALLDLVQRQTFRYFLDFAHPVSGMARERSNEAYNYGNEVVTIGGSGFGVMSLIVADHRKWISHEQAVDRLLKIVNFL